MTKQEITGVDTNQFFGKDAVEWLRRWDAGETVWSVEMGGLGPGYEQCIQIVAAEVVRFLITKGFVKSWFNEKHWPELREKIYAHLLTLPEINELGLSGAQAGAGIGLATHIYREGPAEAFSNPQIKDRLIQVRKGFPGITHSPVTEGE